MKYEDLSFQTIDENGIEMINDIISVIPNEKNSEEPYVVFTDYTLDENDEFIKKYGKLIKEKDNYYLKADLEQSELYYIEKQSKEEIIQYVNSAIEEATNE